MGERIAAMTQLPLTRRCNHGNFRWQLTIRFRGSLTHPDMGDSTVQKLLAVRAMRWANAILVTQSGTARRCDGDAMSGKSYAELLKAIQDLIATGAKISDASAGAPSAQIHQWVSKAAYCLSLLEDKIPTAVSDFRNIRQSFEFKVDDDKEALTSASAYRDGESDVLLDFSFEHLKQANDILKFAATKLEIEGHHLPGSPSDEGLGEELRAARLRAGHTQRDAAEKILCDHKDISEWERGKRKPHPNTAKNIRDYISKHPKNQP
jgi:DNA-binding XRE family transcriptional regulator